MFGAAMISAVPAIADHDVDIHVNGDFRGRPSGTQIVPGWTLTADGGSARLLPGRKPGEAILELIATSYRGQSAVSDLHAIRGNVLRVEVKASGAGSIAVGYELFDAARRPLAGGEMIRVALHAVETEVKHHFTLNAAGGGYIRLRLTAEPSSTARFRDVDAEWKRRPLPPPAPAPGVIAAPPPAPAPGVIAAPPPPAPGVIVAPAPAPAPVPPPPPPPGGAALEKPLQHDRYYSFRSLAPVERFHLSLRVGAKIRFTLGENPAHREFWRIAACDQSMCRIRMERAHHGAPPARREQAEFELKALRPGTSMIELVCGGKRVRIRFSAR